MGKGLGKGLKLSPKAVISALALPLALAVSLKLSSPLWITVYAEETEAITEVSSEENKSESVQDSSSDSSAVTEVNESSDTGDHSDEQIIVDNQDPFTVDSIPADTGYYTDPVSYDDQYVPVDNSGGQSEYAGETGGSYEVLILEPSSDETGNVIASEGSNETDEDATDTIIGNAEGSGEDDPDEEVIEDKDTDSTDPATSITPTDAESDEPKTESDPGETTNEVNDDSVGQGVAQSNQVTFTAAASAPAVTAAASTTEDSLLQKKITNALQENEDSNHQISGVVQIVLDKETSYEGDVEVSYGETGKYSAYTFADDFELELIAEDAGGDGLKADKMTTFKGKMKIVNLHVSMKGINVPGTVEVSGEKGLFDYIGTYLFDTINVVVTDGAKANIDTGDLDDTVTVSVNTNGTADIITGEGDDEIKVTAEDGGTVTIDSGNDIDTITATIGTNGTLIIDSGDGDDIVTLKIKESGNATVSTGDGNDQFTIEKSGSVIDENPGNKVTVSLGEGTNSATVNISIADLIKDIEFNSSATSSDSIHFLGTLKSKSDSDPEDYVAISGTSMDHLVFTNNNKKKLNVTTSNIKVMTDALGNKQKKTLTSKTSDYTYTEADQPFTDYVVTMPSADLGDVVITSKDNQQLLLSSVIINTDSVKVTDNKVTIEKGKTVEVHGLNLILRGREFDIKGKIKADYLRIEASDGTGAHGRSFSDLYSGYNEAENSVSAAIDAGLDMAADLINVSNDAGILIDSDAEIYSAGDVVLSAQVNQNSGMISFLSGINVVNVKVAKAGIDIKGKIFAGWDFSNDTWNKGSYGSVIADAKINTSIGYDTDGKEESGMPLAISVGIADAYINIEQGAEVYAARDIWLNSKSELKIHTRADSGILSSTAPVALGVAVLNNDSNVFVDGTLVAGGNIHATALGNTKAKTISDKGESHDNESGGFFGVSVVLQDVAAELGSHADVNADGSVAVVSKASENIENRAASSTQSIDKKKDDGVLSQVKDMGIKLLTDKVLPWVKEKIREKWLGADSVKMEKLVKAIDKVASSDRSVQIDDDAQSHGEVKVNIENSEASGVSSSTASITITPNSGYQVKKVYVRLYNPGDNSYETKDVPLATDNTYNFLFNKQNAILFVEYEEKDEELNLDELDVFDNSSSSSSDSDIDLQDLIDNINEEDQTSSYHKIWDDSADDSELIKLELSGDGGALLNYETDPNDQNKSYLKAAPGQVLRLIPNPNTNKTLKQGGLTATYKIKENDKDVTKTVIINPNDKGRYIFEIPENILVSEGLKFKAVFVDNGNADAEANTTQTQITGAIAVVVAENDSHAVIASDATVVAAGGVTVNSNVKTVVTNLADGTAVSKTSSSESTKDDTNYAIKRDSEKTYSGFDAPGYQYGLVLENSGNGNVSYQAVDHVNNAYTFTVTPNDGYSVSSVTLVYYQGGDRKTEVLSAGEDGKYTVNLNSIASILSALDKGSIAKVVVTFGKDNEVTVGDDSSVTPIIPNPIKITYNGLKHGTGSDETFIEMGKVYFDSVDTSSGHDVYVFTADPAATYVLDGKLTASWTDLSGSHTVELQKDGDKWKLDSANIPMGALITVSGKFKGDFHDFETTGTITNGTIKIYDKQIKATDKPKILVTPAAGYSVNEITITYTGRDGLSTTTTLTKSGNNITQVKDKDNKPIENLYEFTLPDNVYSGSKIKVTATFTQKTIRLYTGTNSDSTEFTLSESNVAAGDKVTVTASDKKLKEGYHISKVTVVNNANNETVLTGTDTVFTIPSDISESANLTVKVEFKLGEIEVKEASLTNGKIEPVVARSDRGDTVTVKVLPSDGYRIKTGTFKAVIKAKDGSYSSEAYMNRKNDTTYTFLIPSDITDPSKIEISFVGEFIPGQSDNSAYETSLGAGVAVTVANSESDAELRGKVETEKGIKLKSNANGSVSTESKAGFSKTNNGFSGAISVQVASLNAKALMFKTSDVKMNGDLKISAEARPTFVVKADASGNKEAGNVGVGSGIAVAVNGSDVFAGIQDGTKISGLNDGKVRSISITANETLKDTVNAKAGAAGGTAAVPVAAVDVTGSSAVSYFGKIDGDALELNTETNGNVSVSATNESKHTIDADASATGKGTGIGLSVAASVISDRSEAKLNHSIHGNNITVSTNTISELNGNAKASAEGGKKGSGSADKKADGLLGNAGRLANSNKSSSVSSSKVDKAVSGRQNAETSEGSVEVAGAIAVNIQNSVSKSEIADGNSITADGIVGVTSENSTISKIKANAAATNSNIGVGVGAAVNIITIENTAYAGNGAITANELIVTALTRETTPKDEYTIVKKINTYDDLAVQLGKVTEEYITKLIKEMGLDKYGISESLLSEIIGSVTKETAQSLIESTGLRDLLGDGDLSQKYEKALELLNKSEDGLLSLPEQLIEPLLEAIEGVTDLSDLSSEELAALRSTLVENLTAELQRQLKSSGVGLFTSIKDGMVEYLSKNAGDLFSGLFSGHAKENIKKVFVQVKDELLKALKKELKNFTVNTISETIKSTTITGVSSKNVDLIIDGFKGAKNAYTAGNIDNILSSASGHITDTFRTEVFDYEVMITKLAETDFSSTIQKSLLDAAKKASVTLTNSSIAALSDHFDLKLDAEDDPVGHVIDTQAISGAGTKEIGIAGSVAVTVLNETTKAAVSDGDLLKVTGDMTVEAKGLREVTNKASAALDANGDAASNKAADTEANSDVAKGNNTVKGKHVTVDLGAGVEGEILSADKNDDKPKIYITLKDGYKLPETNSKPVATYSYTGTDGKEVTGTIELTKSGDKYIIDPKSGDLSSLAGDKDVRIKLIPEEILYALPTPEIITDLSSYESGIVSVSVTGREAENGVLSAREGDVIEVAVKKGEGRRITLVGYSYVDESGVTHDVEVVAGTDAAGADKNGKVYNDKTFTLKKNSSSEYIYTILAPKGKIKSIVVQIESGEEEEEVSDTADSATTDGTGKTIGVGAAFSLAYGNSETTAEIGRRQSFTAGSLTVNAESEHSEDISSAAGSDPLEGDWDADATKDFALDASVAINILDNNITAKIAEGMKVILSGDLSVNAKEDSETETTASAFSVGESTAVGASVALNIANSSTVAEVLSDVIGASKAAVTSDSHSEDVTKAIATAMGGDIGRTMAKIGDAADSVEDGANKVLDGSYIDSLGDNKKSTKTNDKINQRLDEKKGSDGQKTNSNASTSSNALRSTGVSTNSEDAGSEGTSEAQSQIGANSDNTIGDVGSKTGSKVQVAAAVGITVASHDVSTTVAGIHAEDEIAVSAENTGNFNTTGTGAAMSLAKKANSIAFGVAVSVNNNKATTTVTGDLISSENKNVTVTSRVTQNMDGDFLGKLAAQSLSGSVAGNGSSISLGGAVSTVVSNAESIVNVNDGVTIEGGDVAIEATDKSKLAARAGGLSLSKGSSVGMGIASTTIISSNRVEALLGNDVTVNADSFKLRAEKEAVTDDDFKQLIDMRYLITDSSNLNDDQREDANTGLIDVHKGVNDDSYKVEVNLSEEKLLDAVDGLNFLSSQNTYAEAIAGSISTGSTKANLAGSFAVAVTENNVLASIGNNAKITTRTGAIDINAKNGATTRVIAGSLSAAPAKASVGATVSVMINSDSAIARTGKNASFDAKSDFLHNSSQSGDMQVFTAAMSVAAGADAKNAIGGAINVLVNKGAAESILGDGTAVKAGNDAGITSDALFDLMLISGSANVAVGPQASVAAGGTVNVIVDKVTSRTTLGNNVAVTSGKNTTITSGVSDQLISGALSASAAVSASGKSGAGSVNVIVSKSVADTTIGKGIALKAEAGDIKIRSDNDAWMLNATLAASGSNGTAIGGSFNVNVYERESSVHMSDGTLEAGRNLFVQANGRDKNVMAGFAAAGSVSGTSIAANIAVLIENSTIQTIIEQGITAFAAGNAFLESNFNDFTVGAAGTIAGSLSGSAAGVTSLTVIKNNTVETKLSASRIAAFGTTNATALSEDSTYGVYVGATAIEKQYLGAAGVAVSGGNSVNGVVNVLVNNNKIIADASKASLDYQLNGTTKKYSSKVTVKASDDTRQIILAGGVNLSGGTGVGASVVTLVSGKEVNALAHDMGATGDIKVIANNNDDVTMFAVSAGAASSTSVQIGAAVQVMDSKVLAQVGSEVTSQNGGFDLIANNNTNLVNGAVAVAGGGSAAVTPVAVVTYFTGETSAKLLSNSTVSVKKNMNIKTTADKTIDLYSIGAAVGGTAGVSGTANVLALKDSALAVAENGTTLTSNDGELNIETRNDYTLSAISGTVAVGGTAGVGINAVVSVLKSSAIAELGGRVNLVNGKHDVNVKAISNRKVTNIAATLSGGTVGTGVNVMVLVSGSKMSQDAADMMAYGNSSSKSGDKTFDANSLMATVSSNDNGGSKYYNDKLDGATLAEDTAGNGHYESSQGAGKNSGDSRFDASSGYRSDDFDSTSYDDKSGVQRGENLNASDTKDIADAKQMNTYTYTSAPDDAVIARITKNAIIQNVNDVNVLASQPVMIDLLGVNVSGGAVGVGVSTSVSILHGNVSASSLGTISGANNVTVTAESISGGKLEDRSDALKPILKNLDPSSDGIRVIGATMGAGAVGVSVGVSVNLTDNVTQALLGGNVLNTKNVTVEANQDYGNVLAANGTLGAGAVAVSASASAAQSEAVISSELDSDSYINITGDLNVLSKGTLKANSITATAGAGAVSVNAGVALTINRITQTTGIRKGSTITAKNIYVKAVSDTVADSTLLGVSVGANGTLINVAMSQVDANLDTYVTGSTISATDTFEVYSDVLSTATPKVASLAGGGMAAGGNVLLAFNETKSKTHVSDSIVKNANSMNIVADLQGKATSQLAAGAVGGTSVGLSVNYADMKADNRAILENTNINVKNLRVQTGRGSHDNTSAYAETVSGSMGYISVDLNSAIARNNTKSYAMINGGYITAADGVTVSAGDIVNADAKVTGVNISHTSVAANAVIALNDADTRVIVSSPRIATNKNVDFKVVSNASTSADIVTGGGSLIEAKASVGVAYGRSSSIIDAQVDDLTAASLNVTNTPTSTTTSKITNATYSVAAATAMVGAAYSQDVFDTKVKLGTSTISGDINVLTDYDVSATADVTPHKGGIDAKLLNLQANLALSRNVARASADLIIDTQAKVTAKNVTVKTTGKGNTTAIIRPVKVEVTGVKVVANIANSELSLTQDALIHLNGELNVSGDVNVQSMSNDSKAVASIGTAGVEAGGTVSINVADLGISYAVAKNNMTRTAGIIGKYNPNQIAEPYEETYMETEKYQETMTSIDFYNNVLTKNIPYKIIRQYTERYRDASGALQEIDYVVVELEREVEKTVTKYRYKILGYDGNVINANALNVIAGMNSGSTSTALAQSNGSKSVSLVSAGGLSAESTASDSSNVTLAGFVGNITKTAKVHAETNSNSLAEGMMPGSLTLVSGSVSNVAANVGSSADPQSAKVNFSDSVKLTADILDILADNNGNAKATMEQGTSYSLAKVSTSSQPTNSWYDTGVTIGNGVQLTATGKPSGLTNVPYSQTNIEESSDEIWPLRIVSTTNSAADSAVNSSSIGVGLNMNLMQGKNTITDNNHINVGDDVRLISTWGLRMITRSSTQAHAETVLDGGGLWDGQLGKATNTINRNAGVSVGNNAFIKSEQGSIDFESVLGGKDNIETTVRVKGGGGISAGRSSAETVLTEKNQIQLGMNANITAKKSVNMSALATSHQANNGRGIYTYAKTDSGGLGVDPEAKATTTLNIDNNININKNGSKKSRIEGTDYFVLMNVGNDALYVFTDSGSDGKGIGGASVAESTVYTNINNIIWLDNTHIQAQGASLNAYTSRNDIAKFYVESLAELYAAGGVVKPVSKISGTAKNEIRSSNTANVTGNFLHTAFDPMVDTDTYLKSDYRRLEVKIYKWTVSTTVEKARKEWNWNGSSRCDFCDGTNSSTSSSSSNSSSNSSTSDFSSYLNNLEVYVPNPINTNRVRYVTGSQSGSAQAAQGTLSGSLSKGLATVNDINRVVNGLDSITKARYGEEDDLAAGEIYVLEFKTTLREDVKLTRHQLTEYRLWTDALTDHDVYLLPNSTRLYANAIGRLQYVSEVLSGDVLGNGETHDVDVVTALTSYAFHHPILPIGSSGSLDFDGGWLTIPSKADFELYLNEVSGRWIIDQMTSGFMRMYEADQDAINRFTSGSYDLPEGNVIEGLIDGGMQNGWKLYWVNADPDTAVSDDQALVYLLVNETTNEIDAYRTTRRMIRNGEDPIDVSVYLVRDSKSDRMGIERYNMLFFDTEEGMESLFVVVTDVPEEREMDMPMPLEIKLRAFDIGAYTFAYSLSGHFFVMMDGSDGYVSIFNGFYRATIDDSFESDYVLIEGIGTNTPEVTLKANQPIWAEWSGTNRAEDIAGNRYVKEDGHWYREADAENAEELIPMDGKLYVTDRESLKNDSFVRAQ